jgi:hypothetical protein
MTVSNLSTASSSLQQTSSLFSFSFPGGLETSPGTTTTAPPFPVLYGQEEEENTSRRVGHGRILLFYNCYPVTFTLLLGDQVFGGAEEKEIEDVTRLLMENL